MDENVREIVQTAIDEFVRAEQTKAEPVLKAELIEERRRREELERRVNELAEENKRTRAAAEQAERNAAIRAELQRLGVTKVDLAYKAVRDDIQWSEDGRLVSRSGAEMREFLGQFVSENPELLPPRVAGGSGAGATHRPASGGGTVDLDRIRPGMSPEELDRVRQEIARIASQTLRGV